MDKIFKVTIDFFNTSFGTATIGFIGVVVGCIITHIFNKTFSKTLLKNEIKKKSLDDLQILIINAMKSSAYLHSNCQNISVEMNFLKNKKSVIVDDVIKFENKFENFIITCKNFEKEFVNVMIYLDTHQIILNEFINYYRKLSCLLLDLIDTESEMNEITNNDIIISRKKLNLSNTLIRKINIKEKRLNDILNEIQFHLDNLCRELQNKNYSKMYKKRIYICNDEKYINISLENNKNKEIDFSDSKENELKK